MRTAAAVGRYTLQLFLLLLVVAKVRGNILLRLPSDGPPPTCDGDLQLYQLAVRCTTRQCVELQLYGSLSILRNITETVQLSLSVSTNSADVDYRHVGTYRLAICDFLDAYRYECPEIGRYRFNFTYPYFLDEYDIFADGTWSVRLDISAMDFIDDQQHWTTTSVSTCYMSLVLHQQFTAMPLRKVFVFTSLEVALMIGSILMGYYARKQCRVACLDELTCFVDDDDDDDNEDAVPKGTELRELEKSSNSTNFVLFQNSKQQPSVELSSSPPQASQQQQQPQSPSSAGSYQQPTASTTTPTTPRIVRESEYAAVAALLHQKPGSNPSVMLRASVSPQLSSAVATSSSSSSGMVDHSSVNRNLATIFKHGSPKRRYGLPHHMPSILCTSSSTHSAGSTSMTTINSIPTSPQHTPVHGQQQQQQQDSPSTTSGVSNVDRRTDAPLSSSLAHAAIHHQQQYINTSSQQQQQQATRFHPSTATSTMASSPSLPPPPSPDSRFIAAAASNNSRNEVKPQLPQQQQQLQPNRYNDETTQVSRAWPA